MKKRIVSLLLTLAMVMGLAVSAWAAEENNPHFEYGNADLVLEETIDYIYANHPQIQSLSDDALLNSDISIDDIYAEMSHIYLDIEAAQNLYSDDPTQENANTLNNLVTRKDTLKTALEAYGHIILSQEEVEMIFGETSKSKPYALPDPTKPSDTANTEYILSSLYTTKANGQTVKYFYVTANPLTTKSKMYSSVNIDVVNGFNFERFKAAVVEAYVSKLIGAALEEIKKYASWIPYDLFNNKSTTTLYGDYCILGTYTSTPRFIWAAYPDSDMKYGLLAVAHMSSAACVHTYKSVNLGNSSINVNTTKDIISSSHFSVRDIEGFVVELYEKYRHFIVERCDFKYYFDRSGDGEEELVKTVTAPYASNYLNMN